MAPDISDSAPPALHQRVNASKPSRTLERLLVRARYADNSTEARNAFAVSLDELFAASASDDIESADASSEPTGQTADTATCQPADGTGSIFRRGDVHEYPMHGETILFDPVSGTLFYLNDTARAVWHSCDGRSAGQISAEVAIAYDVDPDRLHNDIVRVLDGWVRSGLCREERLVERQS